MSKLAGYVIVRGTEPEVEVFEGFGSSHGVLQVKWGKPFLGRGVEKFALYKDHIEAEEARRLPLLYTASRIEPLLIGTDKPGESYSKFQELCQAELESGKETVGSQHDECTAQIFAPDPADPTQFASGVLSELLATGSVTVPIRNQRGEVVDYVISLRAQEAT